MQEKRDRLPYVGITDEMLEEARLLAPLVEVERDKASKVDAITGVLGELVFAEYYFGDWREHRVGKNKGQPDFDDIEVKASSTPFHTNLSLLVKEEYARIRKPPFYTQVIIDLPTADTKEIAPGTRAFLVGFARCEEVDAAPLKDMRTKDGKPAPYKCHQIKIRNLRPIEQLRSAIEALTS